MHSRVSGVFVVYGRLRWKDGYRQHKYRDNLQR
nr:MAG TPA: hypothetical protein [Caudoviricetes sp.]